MASEIAVPISSYLATSEAPSHDEHYLTPELRGQYAASVTSSRSQSPTLRPPSPRMTGGPYTRPNYTTFPRASSSISLRPELHEVPRRLYHSTEALVKASSSSSISIRIESAASSDDQLDGRSLYANTAEPAHDTAPPPAVDESDPSLVYLTPWHLDDKKYEPPRLSRDHKFIIDSINAFETDFSGTRSPPLGWTKYIAPEGYPYYYHMEKHILTIANLNDGEMFETLEVLEAKFDMMMSQTTQRPDDADVVLQYLGEQTLGYYLVSWKTRTIFWLDNVPEALVTRRERPVASKSHLGYRIQCEFWRHVAAFPHIYARKKQFLASSVQELKAIVAFGYADLLSSQTSTFAYDPETLRHIIQLTDQIEPGDQYSEYYMNSVARYLLLINDGRFLHFYGEYYARMSRIESVYEGSVSRSPLFRFCSILLFGWPTLYLGELHKVYVDRTMNYYSWRKFINGLKEDWQNSTTPATVLLSANVGFLAIQSIDNLDGYARSLAQIASYASALLSLFEYVVVQILMLRYRQHVFDTAETALDFVFQMKDIRELEWLALTMSFPGALFNWSMITFLLALEFIFYHHSTLSTIVTLSIVVLFLTAVIFLLFLVNFKIADGHALAALSKKLAFWNLFKSPGNERERAVPSRRWSFRRSARTETEGDEGVADAAIGNA